MSNDEASHEDKCNDGKLPGDGREDFHKNARFLVGCLHGGFRCLGIPLGIGNDFIVKLLLTFFERRFIGFHNGTAVDTQENTLLLIAKEVQYVVVAFG